MQITCPNCTTAYSIDPASLGESGRTVRCARCHELWFVEVPHLEPAGAVAASMAAFEGPQSDSDIDWHVGGAPLREADYAAGVTADPHALEGEAAEAFDVPHTSDAPPIADPSFGEAMDAPDAAESQAQTADGEEPDYEEVRRRRAQRGKTKKKSAPLLNAPRMIALLLVVMAALIYLRDNVVRAMPQLASLYGHLGMPVNLRGLAFEEVRTVNETQDGVTVVVIEGVIRNITRHQMEVPRLRFAMRNGAGTEVYSWTGLPERAVLPAGGVQVFSTRLASPPAEGREASVRFIQRRDLTGGGKSSDHKTPEQKMLDHKAPDHKAPAKPSDHKT